MPRKQNTSRDGSLQKHRLEAESDAGVRSNGHKERGNQSRACLIDQVIESQNLWKACLSVKRNHGAPGMDEMTTEELVPTVKKYYQPLIQKLKKGTYQPQPVKRVRIPKPDGSTRKLGIPRVLDRMVQQAIYQVLVPVLDPSFSKYSYGFRPHRSAQMAICQSEIYWSEGYRVAVICDLKSYFDTINHQRLMAYLERFISDKVILKLIWKFLNAGLIDGETFSATREGAPQGGNLSPLLANLYLDQLDKELERRGHKFVRYADDFRIYVRSERAGERVLKSVTAFLENKLGLTVNRSKSCVGSPMMHKFLGVRLLCMSQRVTCYPDQTAKQRLIRKLKKITRRNRPGTFQEVAREINQTAIGWINYYAMGAMKSFLRRTKQWLNHRLRQLIWKRWKSVHTRYRQLRRLGIGHDDAMKMAGSRKKYWRLSHSETLHRAIQNKTLIKWGIKDWLPQYERMRVNYGTAVYGTVRTVV
ncbi:MAG: group II intron reverse transcriptase/maturase [Sporolactobacillus sp.]